MKRTELWIADEWVPAGKYIELKNPHTNEVLAEVGYATPLGAEQAIKAAARAFHTFRRTPAHERSDVLYEAAQLLRARKDEASELIALEAAKPLKAARSEIDRTIATYLFAAEAAKNLYGEYVPMDAAPGGGGYVAYTRKVPMGVVAAITPFNFPFNLVAHKVGPAIAAGNTIVLKPAEATPLSALFLADLFRDAGLPAGVLNIIPGSGEELGETLTTHPLVQYVTFTGSPRVGEIIRAQAGLRRVTLELGSNSPLIVDKGFSDTELNKIAVEIAAGGFTYNGQVCISVQRVYIHESLYQPLLEKVIARAKLLKVGNPLAEDTDISALINDASATRLKGWLDNAVAGGAVIHTGGTFDGNILSPTVVTNVPDDAELNCEEAFGPVISVRPFSTFDDAIRLANESKFGLNAGVFTKNIDRAMYAAEELLDGAVLINQVPTFRLDHMPYGGVKESGTGREGVRYAVAEMMEDKLVVIRTGAFR